MQQKERSMSFISRVATSNARMSVHQIRASNSNAQRSLTEQKMNQSYYENANHVTLYNKCRPSPPEKLIQIIIQHISQEHQRPLQEALDIGCGSGQSTEVLAPFFQKVTGIDPSEEQINEAQKSNKLPNVVYRTGAAEKIDFPDASVNLITASQASHWFDLPKFYNEAGRVLVPGGVLAMYGYLLPKPLFKKKSGELDNLVTKFYNSSLGKYIPPESRRVYLENYKGDDFMNVPFAQNHLIRDESVSSEVPGTVADVIDFMNSGSAFQNYLKSEGSEKAAALLNKFEKEIMNAIGVSSSPQETPIQIEYRYFLLIAKKPLK